MPSRVLVIDDDAAFRRAVARTLEPEGFSVEGAATGKAGISEAHRRRPDLVILDLEMPGLKGLEVCQVFKQQVETAGIPILVLTGNDAEGQDISCLDMGADDYLTKPAKAERLLAHCRALLRRPGTHVGQEPLRAGSLELDLEGKKASLDGAQFPHLTPKEFALLYDLAAHSPKPVDRTTLYREVWGGDPPSEGSLKTVDVHVRRVRLKLGWRSDRWLVAVTGRGYALIPPAK